MGNISSSTHCLHCFRTYEISKGMKGKPSSSSHASKKKHGNDGGHKLSTKTTATTLNGAAAASNENGDSVESQINCTLAPSTNLNPGSTKSSASGGSSEHSARSSPRHSSTLDDTCAINELLEGQMELTVLIVDRKEEIVITVSRRTPLLDLLVSIATQCHFVASNYTIQIEDPASGGHRETKPSTPIGILDVNKILIVPKQQKKGAYNRQKSALPFLPTIRLQINLPQKQMMVKRILPSTLLKDIKNLVCEEKSFNPDRFILVKPLKDGQAITVLQLNQSLEFYQTQEISLISLKTFEQLSKQFSSSSLYHDEDSDRLGNQMDGFCQSTPNIAGKYGNGDLQYKRITSCNESDYDKQSLSSVRTSRSYKKKPAPPPPLKSAKSFQNLTTIRDEDEESNSTVVAASSPSSEVYSSYEAPAVNIGPTIAESKASQPNGVITVQPKHSLSRQNSGSDSSGYHEMLSNTDTPTDSNSPAPPLSISPNPSESYSDSKSLVNNKPVPSQRLSKCKSAPKPPSSNNKKRRAPAAPPVISSSVRTEPNQLPERRIESPESEDLSFPNSLSSEAVSTSAASSSSFADESNLSSLHNQSLSPIVIIKSTTANSSSTPQQSSAAAERAETDNELVTAKYVVIGSADGDISAVEQHNSVIESNLETENADLNRQIVAGSVANNDATKDVNLFIESNRKESISAEQNNLDSQVCPVAAVPESQSKSVEEHSRVPEKPIVEVQIKSDESPEISSPDVVANVGDLESEEKVTVPDKSTDFNSNFDSNSDLSAAIATTESQIPAKDEPEVVGEPSIELESPVPRLPVVPAPRQTILARRQMLTSFSRDDSEDAQSGDMNGAKQQPPPAPQPSARCNHTNDGAALCLACNYYTSNFNRIRAQFSQLQDERQPHLSSSFNKISSGSSTSSPSSPLLQVNLEQQQQQQQFGQPNNHNSSDTAATAAPIYIAICPPKPSCVAEEQPDMDPPNNLVVFSEWKSSKDTDIYFSKSTSDDNNNNHSSLSSLKSNGKSLDRNFEKQLEVTLDQLNECLDSIDIEPDECDNLQPSSRPLMAAQSKLTVQNIPNGHTKMTVSAFNQANNSSSAVVNQNGRTKVQLNAVETAYKPQPSSKNISNSDAESAQNSIVSSSASFASVRDGIRKFNTTKQNGPGSNLTNVYSSSQYDLPSLRSPCSTPGGTLRRSSSRNSQVDSTEPPQVVRKLNNFRIGSFKKDLNIYEEGPNQVKSAGNSIGASTETIPVFPKPANQRQFHTVSGKISHKSPVIASMTVKENTKTIPKTSSVVESSLSSGPQSINIVNKNTPAPSSNSNSRSNIKNQPEPVSFIQELKSRTGTWGSLRSGLTFNDEDTVENALSATSVVEPAAKTQPQPSVSLQFQVNSKKIGAALESNLASSNKSNTNDKSVAEAISNNNCKPTSDHTSRVSSVATTSSSSVSSPIVEPSALGSIPPPPPPPPADYHLTSAATVNRTVPPSNNDHQFQNNSNTLLMPKGWSKSLKPVDSSIRNPLRSISVDNSNSHHSSKSNGYANGNNSKSSSNGEVDAHAALLSEIKNFQNKKLKQVTSNEPFMLEIHGSQVKK